MRYGSYRLFGPAHISKRGDCLIARLLPGARLELLTGGGSGGAAAAPATATAVEAVAKPPTAAVARSRTVTADAAAAGWRAEADGWDVECACNSDDDDDNEAAAAAGAGGDDGAVAECVLVAAYVELGGSASSVDLVDTALQPAVHHVHGHTYLSVRNLPPGAVITISADGDLSHPVNVTPTPPPEAEVPTPAALASTTATDDRRCGERA
ncbi:hypothetical protein PLESTF_000719000 [Pleodorina starrii]|nr:hypothetical protein PLESTM_001709100 [Pleodorina starrii]GLC68649.1 hypothetical protein PLESTF_000719000 [Pleodorina starrii]